VTLNVGVIGTGMIGQDHIRRLTYVLSGARVSAVTDVDLDRAKSVAAGLPQARVACDAGVDAYESGGRAEVSMREQPSLYRGEAATAGAD
jgi:myo-inositol 2-dehydrogenase/D-chiro-inositol 1-dehydrogenase